MSHGVIKIKLDSVTRQTEHLTLTLITVEQYINLTKRLYNVVKSVEFESRNSNSGITII